MVKNTKTKNDAKSKRKINKVCDCCGGPAKYNIKKYDQFYSYLCEFCYEQWEAEHDYSWDNSEY